MASKNHIENVAVIGAGGRMGTYIVRSLLAEGKLKVTAITREDSTSAMPEGVAVKKVDYDNLASLTTAFEGQDALIITMNRTAAPEGQMNIIEAAAAANVRWIMPNWFGGDGTNKSLREDCMIYGRSEPILKRIEELGKSSWVCLTCGFWYEWSLGGFMGMGPLMFGFEIKERTVTFFDDGNTKINISTWAQAGLAVARLFALKENPEGPDDKSPTLSQFKNGFVYVSSFLVSQKDMLESLKRVTGTSDKDWTITYEPSRERYQAGVQGFQKGELPGFAKLLYTRSFYPNGGGNYEEIHGLQNDILGLPEENIDEATKGAIRFYERQTVD